LSVLIGTKILTRLLRIFLNAQLRPNLDLNKHFDELFCTLKGLLLERYDGLIKLKSNFHVQFTI
jgi:hypothetical protein